ncbi:TetR family transcriptional regulator [soil metagenome]
MTAAGDEQRRLRADAALNRDKLLEVAARHFAAEGSNASMKAIASEAGVGIGTLYRRFPCREMLVEATYRSESQRLCGAAYDLLHQMSPLDALRAWMNQFLEYMAAKRGMADSLKVVLRADEHLRLKTREMLTDSLMMLLRAGQVAGVIRPEVEPADVVVALGGFAMITGEEELPDLRRRLLDIILFGLASLPQVSR